MIEGFLETLAEISSENPTLYGLIVVLIILVEGLLLAVFLELMFRILGIEVKETPRH